MTFEHANSRLQLIASLLQGTTQPSAELSRAVRAVTAKVCELHVAQIRVKIPTASFLSKLGALDDLELVLVALADVFEDPKNVMRVHQLGPAHAAAREGQQFTLAEVYEEYIIFRRILEQQVCEYLQRSLTANEREMFQSGIDALMAAMILSFTRQRETRHVMESHAYGDFLSGLAHEVRNEVNGMLMALQLVDIRAEEARAHAKVASPSSQALQELAPVLEELNNSKQAMQSSLKSLGRILEADRLGHYVIAPRDVQLGPLMDGIARSADRLERAKSGLGDSSADLVSRIEIACPSEAIIGVDPDLLTSVLSNFLGNAVKYSSGPIRFAAESSRDGWTISVSDQGPGLTPEQQSKLFVKFERAAPKNAEGYGLGLYIAQKAAKVLGATLAVKSEVGRGSTFSISLPPQAVQTS